MELRELLKMAEGTKELYLGNSYFHGEKVQALLKSLKKHHVSINIQTSFLNAGNCPDLVIEYSGPSVGRFIFQGQVFSRPEALAKVKKEKAELKAKEKEEKLQKKELRAGKKSSKT